MWFRYRFRYRLRYRPKVSANLGFGFGIGPKPKLWFRSYTTLLLAPLYYKTGTMGRIGSTKLVLPNWHKYRSYNRVVRVPRYNLNDLTKLQLAAQPNFLFMLVYRSMLLLTSLLTYLFFGSLWVLMGFWFYNQRQICDMRTIWNNNLT
jgi:hypothetical protein